MVIILVSVIVSAVTTIVITARIKKEIMNYVNEMCEMNIDQTEKIKECALSSIKKISRIN